MEKKLKYDFSGWATRNDLVCSDGRTIRRDAFAHCDGKTVPLVWNHQHDDPTNILGHALLENREDGVYAYCTFNETAAGKAAKLIVQHGDVDSLSIYANGLKQQGGNVMHGDIKELSLVVAGANPGAFIDFVDIAHGEGAEQEVIFCANEPITLAHADEGKADDSADDGKKSADGDKKDTGDGDTIEDVINSLTEKQKTVVVALLANAMAHSDSGEEKKDDGHIEHSDKSEGGDKTMKHNVFEKPEDNQATTLSHSAQTEIIASAKLKSVGTLQGAMKLYAEQHNDTLKHGIDDIEALFPEYKDLRTGAPELITRDQGWVNVVMNKVHKSPISRIRTRNMDARGDDIRAHGYQKGKKKVPSGNMKLMKRTTDPQTIYITDSMHRDDIIDITDFDVVEYQYGVMRQTLLEEVATAILIGDGRDEADEHKISEEHVRSIWNDDDLYTIHYGSNGPGWEPYIIVTNAGARISGTGADLVVSGGITMSEEPSYGSDLRIKNSIDYDLASYEAFFLALKPSTFKYNKGTSGRKHFGFIAQDVEQAMLDTGLTSDQLAALVKDPVKEILSDGITDYRYSIRYGELIALNTHMIQKLYQMVEELLQQKEG